MWLPGGSLGLTGQEVAFLLLGVLVGSGIGAAVTSILRGRTVSKADVRVTVSPNAIPRRTGATLAYAGFAGPALPARGGPADPWPDLAADGPAPAWVRTPVRSVIRPPFVLATAPAGATSTGRLVPVPMGQSVPKHEPPIASPPTAPTASADATVAAALAAPSTNTGAGTALLERPTAAAAIVAGERALSSAAAAEPEPPAVDAPASDGPCAELRTVADERCEVATRARAEAERAQETLRAAQRSYDEHQANADVAVRASDPRGIRAAKDEAQRAFRTARSRAGDKEAIDAAARDWLLEINRINQEAKSAGVTAAREQEAARNLAGSLDRLTVEADAARIAAESADEACLQARQAAADCEESLQPIPAGQPAMPSAGPAGAWTDDAPADAAASALGSGTAPTIFRLLQGDRLALVAVVDQLAGADPTERRAWQLGISNLVDAILATAIEGAALDFPEDDPFWGPFTAQQSRDIVAALSSLGYRFDGLGGWVDGRVPTQRDLALALGYAGLDPMRMRHWPNETEMLGLFRNVRVAAAEYLALSAGDLTLGELVTMLGPRADALTDVWNAWGRIRPLLLEER
jgi:hypothetical protein